MRAKSKTRLLISLIALQEGLCFYCGRLFSHEGKGRPTLDHRVPEHAGGTLRDGNAAAACTGCNSRKGPLDEETFRRLRASPQKLRQELSRVNAIVANKKTGRPWFERRSGQEGAA